MSLTTRINNFRTEKGINILYGCCLNSKIAYECYAHIFKNDQHSGKYEQRTVGSLNFVNEDVPQFELIKIALIAYHY